MTDRYYALTVVLEGNVRDDDAEPLIAAIRQLRGVADVLPHVADTNTVVGEVRARTKITERVMRALRGVEDGGIG